MSSHELEQFLQAWEFESDLTVKLLRSLPQDQYDFRPYPESRSLGELAWHLAEVEAIMTRIAAGAKFDTGTPPGIERPRTVPELATGYERVHREAVERARALKPEDLDREFPFFDGQPISVRKVLWFPLLHHLIHHRGQLMMMIRMAHGVPSRVYGPKLEDDVIKSGEARQPAP